MEMVVRIGAKLQSNCQETDPNFLQAGRPSCCQTNSVRALKENEHTCTLVFRITELLGQGSNG